MASVIAVISANAVGGEARVIPSWRPAGKVEQFRVAARALVAIARLPKGTVVHAHLSERGSFVREGVMVRLARLRGLPTAVTIHGAGFDEFAEHHPRVVKAVLDASDLVLALTETTLATVLRVAPTANAHLISNPIEVDTDVMPAGDCPELVLFAGEIGVRKGADVAHAAWPLVRDRCPNARLELAGPKTELDLTALPGLTVLPPVSRDQLRTRIRQSRLLILPSRAEALPMVLLETQASARPFVSTPVGEIAALAAKGGGVTVPVDDPAALADAVVALLEQPDEATAMGQRGLEVCREDYSVESVDRRMIELYRDITAPSGESMAP